MLSIRMLKICDDSLCGPLGVIFQSCFENDKFPSEWKKANAVPTYKKNDKQLVKNYRTILSLPTCGKIFEHLIYNNCWLLLMKYINHLTMNMKRGESFSIFLKHLIKYSAKVLLYIN